MENLDYFMNKKNTGILSMQDKNITLSVKIPVFYISRAKISP